MDNTRKQILKALYETEKRKCGCSNDHDHNCDHEHNQGNEKKDEEPKMKFPCSYPIKAFGVKSDTLVSHTHSLLSKHVPGLLEEHFHIRESKEGKYLSLTVTITAESRQQLDEIYQTLKDDERILYAL